MTDDTRQIFATRTVDTRPEAIFGILADPARHHDTEPGDWVRDAIDTAPITRTGQVFGVNMFHTQAGGAYVIHNRVTAFEPDRLIEWSPGQLDADGNQQAGGWRWRYRLDPRGDGGTDVTLTYDWADATQEVVDQFGGLPPFPPDYLDASLATLAETAARD